MSLCCAGMALVQNLRSHVLVFFFFFLCASFYLIFFFFNCWHHCTICFFFFFLIWDKVSICIPCCVDHAILGFPTCCNTLSLPLECLDCRCVPSCPASSLGLFTFPPPEIEPSHFQEWALSMKPPPAVSDCTLTSHQDWPVCGQSFPNGYQRPMKWVISGFCVGRCHNRVMSEKGFTNV